MSKYTTEVRYICESYSQLPHDELNNIDKVLSLSWDKIFIGLQDTFDPEYKSVICQKILKHYYMREIGAETAGLWRFWMSTRFNELLPKYNKLWYAETLKFDPLHDVDITREHDKTNQSDTTGKELQSTSSEYVDESTGKTTTNVDSSGRTDTTSESSGKNTYRMSDTPQGSLQNIENNTYLSEARITDDSTNATQGVVSSDNQDTISNVTSNTTGTSSGNVDRNTKQNVDATEKYLERVTGKQGSGSFSEMVMKYRDSLINVDLMFIEEFADLFMGIW